MVDPQVEALLEERRITEEEIRNVIESADSARSVFTHSLTGRCLASLSLPNATTWVEYSRDADSFRVYSAYTHRMKIIEGFNMPPKVKGGAMEWLCMKCSVPLELATVKLTYLDETFAADTPACPVCQRALVSEEDAVRKMALAEKMLEDK